MVKMLPGAFLSRWLAEDEAQMLTIHGAVFVIALTSHFKALVKCGEMVKMLLGALSLLPLDRCELNNKWKFEKIKNHLKVAKSKNQN